MGILSFSERARKRIKQVMTMPISSAPMNAVRAYGPRNAAPSNSISGSLGPPASRVPTMIRLDIEKIARLDDGRTLGWGSHTKGKERIERRKGKKRNGDDGKG
jgi:hypothetical protein